MDNGKTIEHPHSTIQHCCDVWIWFESLHRFTFPDLDECWERGEEEEERDDDFELEVVFELEVLREMTIEELEVETIEGLYSMFLL